VTKLVGVNIQLANPASPCKSMGYKRHLLSWSNADWEESWSRIHLHKADRLYLRM